MVNTSMVPALVAKHLLCRINCRTDKLILHVINSHYFGDQKGEIGSVIPVWGDRPSIDHVAYFTYTAAKRSGCEQVQALEMGDLRPWEEFYL